MRLVIAVAVVCALIGAGVYVFTDTAAGFRSVGLVALAFDVPHDELNTARQPIAGVLPAALSALNEGDGDVDISLVLPDGDSRIEVVVTSPEPERSRQAAASVSAEVRRLALDERLASTRADLAEVDRLIDENARDREQLETEIDRAIRAEGLATRRKQEAIQAGLDETELRSEEVTSIAWVKELAARRDLVVDEEHRLVRESRRLELEIALNQNALFLVPPTQPSEVSGSPLRNSAAAFLFSIVTISMALAVVHVGRRAS